MQQNRHNYLPKVFVTGDLMVDYLVTGAALGKITRVPTVPPRVGGSAYNAAIAFRSIGFPTSVFGKVGQDDNAKLILPPLQEHEVITFIERHVRHRAAS
jgi:sugar/nucleoside kinase (ribokinase family)